MPFPETLAEREVAQILEEEGKEGIVEQPIPAPVIPPSFRETVDRWRERLFPVGAVLGASLVQSSLYLWAPAYYRWENGLYIWGLSLAGVVAGVVVAEAFAYYFADSDIR